MDGHNKSLGLTCEFPTGSGSQADNSDQVGLMRACSSTLCYVTLLLCQTEIMLDNRKVEDRRRNCV